MTEILIIGKVTDKTNLKNHLLNLVDFFDSYEGEEIEEEYSSSEEMDGVIDFYARSLSAESIALIWQAIDKREKGK